MADPMSSLRRWRIEQDWTVEEMADVAGLSAAMVSRAERGERRFSPSTKVRIARRLGVRVRDLFPVDEDANNG